MDIDVKTKRARLKTLFFSTLYLSTFTFGGGYVIISLLKKKFVDELKWINNEEMLDYVAIAQSAPGPIAVNGAIVIGYKICGLWGIFFAVLGAVIPPFVILTVISAFYSIFKSNQYIQAALFGMKSGVSAVIVSVVWDMAAGVVRSKDALLIVIMVISFILNYYFNVNVVLIILGTLAIGIARSLITRRIAKC
jgi:chromate transporter